MILLKDPTHTYKFSCCNYGLGLRQSQLCANESLSHHITFEGIFMV